MELKLFLLDVGNGEVGRLVIIYAQDETNAWVQAAKWALETNTKIPHNATLIELPYSHFKIHRRSIPRTINTEQYGFN
jgi:hypothetical protein